MSPLARIENAGAGRNQGLVTGLALSLALGLPVRLEGLKNDELRPEPGLGPGGFTAALAAARISGGRVEGGPGRTELEFHPGPVRPGDYSFDLAFRRPTPAPLSLVLQALALPLARLSRPSSLVLAGGTHVPLGLSSDEVARVLVPNWRALGLAAEYTEISPGFLPKAKGEAEAGLGPGGNPRPLLADSPFRAARFGVEVLISGLPVHLGEQALEGALSRLELHGLPARGRLRRARGGRGMALLVWAQGRDIRVGYSALGRRGGQPHSLGIKPVEALKGFLDSGAGISAEAAAPLLSALACASGVSRLSVDRLTPTLRAALRALAAFQPQALRVDHSRPGRPVEIRILGLNPPARAEHD